MKHIFKHIIKLNQLVLHKTLFSCHVDKSGFKSSVSVQKMSNDIYFQNELIIVVFSTIQCVYRENVELVHEQCPQHVHENSNNETRQRM